MDFGGSGVVLVVFIIVLVVTLLFPGCSFEGWGGLVVVLGGSKEV